MTAAAGPDRTGVVARLDALEAAHKAWMLDEGVPVAFVGGVPRLIAAVRGVLTLAEDLDSYVAARGRPATGTYDDGLNRAQAAVAADLRSIVAATLGEAS